jgi:hypothetical protein
MLGGKIGPIAAVAMVNADAKLRLYPSDSIAWISTGPRQPISANAEPEIPEKIKLMSTLMRSDQPIRPPNKALENLNIFSETAQWVARFPTSRKSGTAIKANWAKRKLNL